jgi:4-hydroxy-2-oxoheptanedioate aldolase
MTNRYFPDLKSRIARNGSIAGLWMMTVNPAFAELASLSELDFLIVDLEHGAITLADLPGILRAFSGDTAAIVRVPSSDPTMIARVMDRGAHGVMIPRVESVEEAQQASAAAKYPPRGSRGIAFPALRASSYGMNSDYRASADNSGIVIIQIESQVALNSLSKIAELDCVDAVFLGPADLSADINLEGSDDFDEVIEGFLTKCKDLPCLSGTVGFGGFNYDRLVNLGCQIMVIGSDVSIMRAGVSSFKKQVGIK